MKKKICHVMFCVFFMAVLMLLAGCGTSTPTTESAATKEQKEILEKGEMYKSQGNYRNAIEAFKSAGEPGQDSLKQTVLEYATKANFYEYETATG